jgi:hypothetical protein
MRKEALNQSDFKNIPVLVFEPQTIFEQHPAPPRQVTQGSQ